MLDFGVLPPEVNSGLMYAGAGSASMMGAASEWNILASELNSAAAAYDRVVTTLSSEEWLGQASALMAEAVTPYVQWMRTTAAAAEHAASQATSAAQAFETAHAAIVPPPVIAANRVNLAQLQSANVMGQNTAAIAALEAQYQDMWAIDSDTMYNYAGRSANTSAVKPFTSAPHMTNPGGTGKQESAVAAATGTSVGTAQNTLRSRMSNITSTLGKLAQAAAPADDPVKDALTTGPLGWLGDLLTFYAPFSTTFYNTEGLPFFSAGLANTFLSIAKSTGALGGAASAAAPAPAAPPAGGPGLAGGGAPVTGTLGNAGSVGRLSVPPVWANGSPVGAEAAAPLPISNIRETPDSGIGNVMGGLPLTGPGDGGAGRTPRYGWKPTVMARPPFAG
ncbi:PPE family protein [Mycobacterium montefiorense]|uniref:PPE family protein n=1 Tax=Mycobacterium montefiorense TaxID=154654 RepID=A0AA37PQW9_9MYCO|nr:PPE family protein [Mycobacterium montefiorense]GBG40375.1 PPE family protein [Mycobacterium montefiorense]GKU33965.1 PPE family protein [Mycobacterium montefiorense]GKU42498.1 PPE family protein [Mycobacterium montefiorense]GKU46462.1 PPE family protein [Mycobacterium montefiorense]GKU53657.1 PPE family protein [Mycobacterium montefiorense]